MKTNALAALGACTLLALPARAAEWGDTFLGYRHGSAFQEPGSNTDISKDILSLTHVSGYSLGGNFFNVDMLMSGSEHSGMNGDIVNDPEGLESGSGAQEVYVTYKTSLSLGKLVGTKLAFGPIRDISLSAGFDFNSKNTRFAPRVFKLMAGPTFHFAMPKGFLGLSVLYYSEKNHNYYAAYGQKGDVRFAPTIQIAGAWLSPISFGPVDSNFKGWFTYTATKGRTPDVPVDTRPETLVELSWMFDAGKLLGMRKGALYLGPGYQYWANKFGNPEHAWIDPDAFGVSNKNTSCFQLELEWHF